MSNEFDCGLIDTSSDIDTSNSMDAISDIDADNNLDLGDVSLEISDDIALESGASSTDNALGYISLNEEKPLEDMSLDSDDIDNASIDINEDTGRDDNSLEFDSLETEQPIEEIEDELLHQPDIFYYEYEDGKIKIKDRFDEISAHTLDLRGMRAQELEYIKAMEYYEEDKDNWTIDNFWEAVAKAGIKIKRFFS